MHMELTRREEKLIERLRKQERQWPRLRWFVVGTGVFALLCSGFIAIELVQHIDTMLNVDDDVMSRGWLLGFALFWPKCLIYFGFGAFLIIWAIKDWHGNANRVLLLKLLEARRQDEAPDVTSSAQDPKNT
jgi:hypothetical protein